MRKTRKANDELDFAPSLKLEMRIECKLGYIGKKDGRPLTLLRFQVYSGSAKWEGLRGLASAYIHSGERKGAEWEIAKRIWRREHRYITEHIRSMIFENLRQLLFEVPYAGREDIDYESLFHTSADLRKYDEVLDRVEKEGGVTNPFDSPIQARVAGMAQAMRGRIMGFAWLNIGNDQQFYFTKLGMERVLNLYRERMKVWRRVRKFQIEQRRNPDWRKEAQVKYGPLPDDLLTAITEKKGRKVVWKPSQIAIVDAARRSGILGNDYWFGKPKINQWQTLKREIDRGAELLREAKRLGLKW